MSHFVLFALDADSVFSARPLNMEIHIQSFTIPHFPSLMIAMSKPAYLAILEYSPSKPVIIFVPSRRQCRLTVDDLITHCTADDDPERFLYLQQEQLEPHLERLDDKGLVEPLKHGIGYYHEALSKQDKVIVQRLFESGAVQVLVASKVCENCESIFKKTDRFTIGYRLELACRWSYGDRYGCTVLRGEGTSLH